ncbi:MAG: tetratricopeptide repeat protein [Henriciella sp.]
MQEVDLYELPISTCSKDAAHFYRDATERMLMAIPGAATALDACLEADNEFSLGFAARARQHMLDGERDAAIEKMRISEELIAVSGSSRERSHVQILSLTHAGKAQEALELAQKHVDEWPRDTMIASLLLSPFGLLAFSGMREHNQAKSNICERIASAFDPDDWWFLTYHGWSLCENGDLTRGRPLIERGFELRKENANCVHALSHAMFDAGHMDEADSLLRDWLPSYDRSGLLHGHISWHAALSAFEVGDTKRVLDIYKKSIRPAVSLGMPINILSDAASLFWRMKLLDYGLPDDLLKEVEIYSRENFPKSGHRFIDMHLSLLDALIGDKKRIRKRIEELDQLNSGSHETKGIIVQQVSAALISFLDGQFRESASILEAIHQDVSRIGGSNAQRRVVEDTLVMALVNAGEQTRAKALLERRLLRRPSSLDQQLIGRVS